MVIEQRGPRAAVTGRPVPGNSQAALDQFEAMLARLGLYRSDVADVLSFYQDWGDTLALTILKERAVKGRAAAIASLPSDDAPDFEEIYEWLLGATMTDVSRLLRLFPARGRGRQNDGTGCLVGALAVGAIGIGFGLGWVVFGLRAFF